MERQTLKDLKPLLKEAADSVHASLAETDISDDRRRYRNSLEEMLRVAGQTAGNREASLEVALQIVLAMHGHPGIWITTCNCRPSTWMPTWFQPALVKCQKCSAVTDCEWIDGATDRDVPTCKVPEASQ